MKIKTKIKNDLWHISYLIPFSKKYLANEAGKLDSIKQIWNTFRMVRPIKSKGKRSIGADTKEILEKAEIQLNNKSHFVYFIDQHKTIAVRGNVFSNFTLAYDKIIHGCFSDLEKTAYGNDIYGQEALLVSQGIRNLISRIIIELNNSDHPFKLRLINNFSRMLDAKAEHFDEGLQRILFFNQVMWQTRHRLNGLGRLDKILSDLYQNDIKTGFISYEDAQKLVSDFLSCLTLFYEYKSDALFGDIGQIIILGGLEPDKNYFFNDLTKIFLQEQANLKRPDPKLLLRVSKNMPDELLKMGIDALQSATGSPLFSNDDVVIPALLSFGMPEVDAYNYCTSACWEPYIVGKSLDQNNIAAFDYFIALDDVLNESFDTFDQLVNRYNDLNQQKFKSFLSETNNIKWARDTLVSMFTDGCSEARTDISEGACRYRNYGITTVGLPNVIDTLLNIKKIVFDDREYELTYLNKSRKNDFRNDEKIYEKIQSLPKHFGHDDIESVKLTKKIIKNLDEIAINYRNIYNGTIKFGLSSPSYNDYGKKTRADLSGRKAGMPYNPHISCSDAGYTEVVNFASQLDYKNQNFNGNVVDFFVSPDFIKRNSNKFFLFMKGAIKTGFFQMQMNVLDSKTLIAAREHPENYKGLIVRVWGFSAYFNELPESYKDLLIARAIAAEKQNI